MLRYLKRMRANLATLSAKERGAVAIEYAFIALLVAIVLIALIISIGTSVKSMFMSVATGF